MTASGSRSPRSKRGTRSACSRGHASRRPPRRSWSGWRAIRRRRCRSPASRARSARGRGGGRGTAGRGAGAGGGGAGSPRPAARHRVRPARASEAGGGAARRGGRHPRGHRPPRRLWTAPVRRHRQRQDRGLSGRPAACGGGRPARDRAGAGDRAHAADRAPLSGALPRPRWRAALRPQPGRGLRRVARDRGRRLRRRDRLALRDLRAATGPRADRDRRGARVELQAARPGAALRRSHGGDAAGRARGRRGRVRHRHPRRRALVRGRGGRGGACAGAAGTVPIGCA